MFLSYPSEWIDSNKSAEYTFACFYFLDLTLRKKELRRETKGPTPKRCIEESKKCGPMTSLVSPSPSHPPSRVRPEATRSTTGFLPSYTKLDQVFACILKLSYDSCSLLERRIFHGGLLIFTGFYRLLLGFTGFYWILLGFTGFYWGRSFDCHRFYWVFLGFAGCY